MNSSQLKMFFNGEDLVIAKDLHSAKQILCKSLFGEDQKIENLEHSLRLAIEILPWREKSKDDVHTLYEEESAGVTKRVEQWIEEIGEGYFASVEKI